jgi:hypothetical protein
MGKLNSHHAQNATYGGSWRRFGYETNKFFITCTKPKDYVPIHSLHSTHNFKRKETSKKCGVSTQSVLFEVQDVSQICECTEAGEQSLN